MFSAFVLSSRHILISLKYNLTSFLPHHLYLQLRLRIRDTHIAKNSTINPFYRMNNSAVVRRLCGVSYSNKTRRES